MRKKFQIKQKCNLEQGNQKLISQSNTKILVTRLERKLNDTLNEVDEQNSGQINFQQLGRLFTLLDIFQAILYNQDYQLEAYGLNNPMEKQQEVDLPEKAFAIISNDEEKIDIQAVFYLFRIILDPNQLEPSKCAILIKEYLEQISEKKNDYEEIFKFCSEFQSYQHTQLSSAKFGQLKASLAQIQSKLIKRLDALQQQSGKKEIQESSSQISQGLAESRVNELYKKKELSNQKICKNVHLNLKLFQKKNYLIFLDRLYQVKNRQEIEERAKLAEKEKEESEYSKCSFHPQINYSLPESQQNGVGGYQETIERIRRANDKIHLNHLKLNSKPSGDNYEKIKNKPFLLNHFLMFFKKQIRHKFDSEYVYLFKQYQLD